LAITTSILPPGTTGSSYSTALTAAGGTGPYTWSATGVPAGLSINESTGEISGTPTAAGTSTVTVTVRDSAGNSDSVVLSLTVSRGSTGSGGGDNSPPDIVNSSLNDIFQSPIVSNKVENGQDVITATIDEAKALNSLKQNPDANTLVIPVTESADIVRTEISGTLIEELADRDVVISFQSATGSYNLPASEIDVDRLAEMLGVDPDKLKITVEIAKVAPGAARTIQQTIQDSGLTQISAPVEFNVTVTAGDNQAEVSSFGTYVSRTIRLTGPVDPDSSVGVVVNPDGTLSPVPTYFTTVNGQTEAFIRRNTNSTYTIISYEKNFADTNGHWAENDISILANKLIISGKTQDTFAPDDRITRAEFTAILVRAMGLQANAEGAGFSDVRPDDWYAGAIGAAVEAGIITGYTDGTFRPKVIRMAALFPRQTAPGRSQR
jgi:hypothetical protein